MLDKETCLRIIAKHRTDEVVVTTMGTAAPWGQLSNHALDFASVGSAMGHAADFALGIAIAQPRRKVIVLNGDGSMLMCLGTLATVTGLDNPCRNYYLFVCENGTYEVTGNQPTPGKEHLSFAAIARASGFSNVHEFSTPDTLDAALPDILSREGPTFVTLKIAPGVEPPPNRQPDNPVAYLRPTLAESTHALRHALQDIAQ